MVLHDCGVGTALTKRELVGRADSFPVGTRRVYAWFEVTLPERHRQKVLFHWYREDKQIGTGLYTSIVGAAKTASAPGPTTADRSPAPGASTC